MKRWNALGLVVLLLLAVLAPAVVLLMAAGRSEGRDAAAPDAPVAGAELARLARGYNDEEETARAALLAAGGVLFLCATAAALVFARAFRADVVRARAGIAAAAITGREPIVVEGLGFSEAARAIGVANELLARAAERQADSLIEGAQEDETRRTKIDHLAGMSHDLRSPLNAILGFSELLLRGLDGELPDADRGTVMSIQRSGRRLLRLINEILDTARCEAGKLALELSPVMPAEAIRQANEDLRRGHELPADLEIVTELQPGIAALVADPMRLPQAIGHLLSHALAGAPAGAGIALCASDRDVDGTRHFVVEVSHAGASVGGDWPRLPFAVHRLGPGDLGLALPLARRLAELHGGHLLIGDEAGRARYTLMVPAGPRKERLAALRLVPKRRKRSVD